MTPFSSLRAKRSRRGEAFACKTCRRVNLYGTNASPLPSLDPVDFRHVLADDLLPGWLRHRLDQLAQLVHVIPRVVEVREVRRPEELVRPDKIDDVAEGFFVRVARNPALPVEVITRLLLQPHSVPQRTVVHRVHAVEQVARPAGARL